MTALTVAVEGVPVPQGSMIRTNFGMRHSKPEAIALFRSQVGIAVRDAAEKQGVLLPLEGPLMLSATFVLPRPKSAPKRRVWPELGKDLDKLCRALDDALTQCGAWMDDSQVVEIVAGKRYTGQEPALLVPGTRFTIQVVA
jgi:crossover junction endodeoxyribonuclease RusA